MSNTTVRILTAAVVVPILLILIYIGGLPFTLFVVACMGIGLVEFYRMAENKGFQPNKLIGILVPTLGTLALGMHYPRVGLSVLGFGLLLALTINLRKPSPEGSMSSMAVTVLGMVYVGLLAHAVLIREYSGGSRKGIFFILLALAGSMLCDSAAYFVGRAYGTKKLIPHISPGKTVQGSIGGLAGGVLGVYLFKVIADLLFYETLISWWHATLLGLLLALAGMVGDLVESMLKRDAGVKDSGNVFPGHGGMLDRLDSPLFTLTVTFYFALVA